MHSIYYSIRIIVFWDKVFGHGRKRVWFISDEYYEEDSVFGVDPFFCECKLL